MANLLDKTALVTGASRGIGRAIAATLANAGARVLVHYGNSEAEAECLVSEIESFGGRAEAVQADLSKPEGVTALSEQVSTRVSKLDIVVANAGISKAGTLEAHSVEDFDRLFATNVRAPFLLIKELSPAMTEGGNIVVITSLAARTALANANPGAPTLPVYASTKGALETLVKHLAAMLGPRGIRVNAVAPGVIETDLSNFTKTAAGREIALNMQALKRIGRPSDVADVVAFLVSEEARWITGASIPVDGGSNL